MLVRLRRVFVRGLMVALTVVLGGSTMRFGGSLVVVGCLGVTFLGHGSSDDLFGVAARDVFIWPQAPPSIALTQLRFPIASVSEHRISLIHRGGGRADNLR